MNEIQQYTKCQQAIELKTNIESSYLYLARLLKEIRDERAYQPQYDKFHEWLQELDMTEGTASKMISIYEKLMLNYGFSEAEILGINGWSKAFIVAKNSQSKEEAKEFISLAKTLTRSHLEQSIREKKTGLTVANCGHEYVRINYCKKCGDKFID